MDWAFFQYMDWASICQIFEEEKYRLDFGKSRQQPKEKQCKAVKRLVKYENLEKLSKWTGLFG